MGSCNPFISFGLRLLLPAHDCATNLQVSSILRSIVLNCQRLLIPACMYSLYAGQILIAMVTSLSRP